MHARDLPAIYIQPIAEAPPPSARPGAAGGAGGAQPRAGGGGVSIGGFSAAKRISHQLANSRGPSPMPNGSRPGSSLAANAPLVAAPAEAGPSSILLQPAAVAQTD